MTRVQIGVAARTLSLSSWVPNLPILGLEPYLHRTPPVHYRLRIHLYATTSRKPEALATAYTRTRNTRYGIRLGIPHHGTVDYGAKGRWEFSPTVYSRQYSKHTHYLNLAGYI